ncbi:MAG: endolytic transglycosylase MltG [Actinobacteria bacterium]|uniref:Unannotated protein n=1 Tax=freshwater metagenome TaxID=449393 RepID=A0A6J6AK44_9ZZZZ|nr:endolytic transglycosylase MltG [Actinomycetota bacterium]
MKRSELVRVVFALVLVAILTLLIHQFRSVGSSTADFPIRPVAVSEQLIDVHVAEGSSGSEIATQLFELGIIESSQSFFKVAVSDVRAARIAPGIHQLNNKIAATQALEQLLDPARIPNLIKIFEGGWNIEIFAALEQNGFAQNDILKAAKEVQLPQGFTSLEGVLYPAQYSFTKEATAKQALEAMINRFTLQVADLGLANDPKLKAQELITIASIIQAEGDIKDFAKVSQVIRNRLRIGMPLQMDSTVHYVKKVRGSVFLSTQSTLMKSPFNTYRKYGLPPAPIGNPGLEAIKAAINPAAGDWLYFITVSPGDTRFTADIAEFNQWKALYTKNRKAGAFN